MLRLGRGPSSAVAFSDIALRLSTFVVIPAALSELGVALFGVYAAASSIAVSLGPFDLGLSSSLARFAADRAAVPDRRTLLRLFAVALTIYVVLSVIVVVLVLAAADDLIALAGVVPAERDDARVLVVGCSAVFGLSSACALLRSLLQGRGRVALAFRITGATHVGMTVLAVLAGVLDLGAAGFVGVLALPYLMQALALSAACAIEVSAMPAKAALAAPYRRFLLFGMRMQTAVTADFMVFVAPRAVGAGLAGAVAVASLDVGLRAAQLAGVLVIITLPALLPTFTGAIAADDHARFRALVAAAALRAVRLAALAASVLAVLAEPLMELWLPVVPEGAVTNAHILLLGVVPHAIAGVFTVAAQASERLGDVVRLKIGSLLLAVVLLPVLGPLGSHGLAAAVALSLALPSVHFFARSALLLGAEGRAVAERMAAACACAAVGAAAALLMPLADETSPLTVVLARGAVLLVVAGMAAAALRGGGRARAPE